MTVKSRADELNDAIANLTARICTEEQNLETLLSSVEAVRRYIDHLHMMRTRLEAQLEREDTILVKPVGPCVTLTAHDGVEWDV